ncbi:MAG TPA: hypothetical protein VG889_09675 [Rhizomicrobium sp.]|nr:hypothetical protein [Rhizomicrobium sp.]
MGGCGPRNITTSLALLALAVAGCGPVDNIGEARRAYDAHGSAFREIAGIAKAHPEIKRYEPGPLVPDRDAAGPLRPDSHAAYARVSDLMESARVDVVEVLISDPARRRPSFQMDVAIRCRGWHRSSACADVVYDEGDTVRSATANEKCAALDEPHWYACDEH